MSQTPQLGTSSSQLGNVELGENPLLASTPKFAAQLGNPATQFGKIELGQSNPSPNYPASEFATPNTQLGNIELGSSGVIADTLNGEFGNATFGNLELGQSPPLAPTSQNFSAEYAQGDQLGLLEFGQALRAAPRLTSMLGTSSSQLGNIALDTVNTAQSTFTGVPGVPSAAPGNFEAGVASGTVSNASVLLGTATAQAKTTAAGTPSLMPGGITTAQAKTTVGPNASVTHNASILMAADANMLAPAAGEFPGWLDLSQPVNYENPLNRNRIGWWVTVPGLDGGSKLYDLIGNYPGTLNNVQWSPSTQPGSTSALNFNQSNSYVGVTSLNWTGLAAASMSLWLNVTNFDTNGTFANDVIGITNNTFLHYSTPFVLQTIDSRFSAPRSLQFIISTSTTGTGTLNVGSTITLNIGQWYHVVCVYDGTAARLYVNGKLHDSANVTGTLTSNGVFNIGSDWSGSGQNYAGYINDASLWTRGLSAAEVEELYNDSLTGNQKTLNYRQITFNRSGLIASTQHNAATTLGGSEH